MPWHQFWKRNNDAENEPGEAVPEAPSATLPPHMQRIVGERKRPEGAAPDLKAKLARLERNRLASLYDIEQGELANAADNPWRQRIELLTDAVSTVQEDLKSTSRVIPGPFHQLPETAITSIEVSTEPMASVAFSIGNERFSYSEDIDWSERSHQLAQSELQLREGGVSRLVPDDVDAGLREPLRAHLEESLFVFASYLRYQVLDDQPLPPNPTLADLANPCPVCGGWTDWHGTCQNCRQRDVSLQALKREENRLFTERDREAEEQHRLKERLPIARRKLRDIDAEIEQLRAQM
jgi:hypothetical protein